MRDTLKPGKLTDERKLTIIPHYLRDDAIIWFNSNKNTINTWIECAMEAQATYTTPLIKEQASKEVRNRQQGFEETLLQYYICVQDLCRTIDSDMTDATKLNYLIWKQLQTMVDTDARTSLITLSALQQLFLQHRMHRDTEQITLRDGKTILTRYGWRCLDEGEVLGSLIEVARKSWFKHLPNYERKCKTTGEERLKPDGIMLIYIYLLSIAQHLFHLNEICRQLKHARSKLNSKKCIIAKTETEYLDHQVKQGNIRPSLDEICGLSETQIPKTAAETCRFVWAAEYYSKCIPNF
ncbi:unnamed protein product [Didymodactylos carnosus]|uniref:Uncharacterized protein n=1 Tax=Didymodactylos carnosus TaxID=1234261 RepID=A0A8S2DMV2_9BILA|nr:unnamed protein product [Didymodactylos carnosus]CAF3707548.1 unnamed protein product [Didymodactylos carnosus]